MRIGLFSDTYPPYINGVATSTFMLKNALESLGHDVYVVTVNSVKLEYNYDEKNKILYVPGIPTGIYNYRLSNGYPIGAIRKIKKMNLDVIHSQQEFGIGALAIAVSKQFGIPLVHTYHTEYEEHIKYISKGNFSNITNKIVKDLATVFCDKTVDELIVPTKKIYDIFKNKYNFKRDIFIVPTGIELERFYQKQDVSDLKRKLGLSNSFVILYLGRIGFEKNIDLLIQSHKYINKKAKLLIVGDGPDINKYKEMVKKYDVENRVVFAGKVPWEDVPKYYQLADVFGMASQSETQGLTVIEAMASSLPIVCIDDESFKGTVIDESNGLIFKNEKEYVDKINYLINKPNILLKMGTQSRIDSIRFSSTEFAKKVLEVYYCALKKGNFITKIKYKISRVGIKW